jgi:predicted nucleic acid-binding protein
MAWIYLDTSALVKRYIREPRSAQVRALLRRHDFVSSAITPVEIASALHRRRREGDLSEENFAALTHRVRQDRLQWELVEVSSVVLDRAEELLQGVTPIRTVDAIQVASVLVLQSAARMPISFVTADVRQREAATELGLNIIWMGN